MIQPIVYNRYIKSDYTEDSMKLIYENTTTEVNQDEQLFNTIIEKVNEAMTEEEKVFSHLIIDGTEVFEDHEAYIQQHLGEMMEIHIITRTKQEIIDDILQSIHSYLERAIPAIDELVNESFTGFTDESWLGIAQLTEGMEWMLQFIEALREADEHPTNWQEINESFTHCEEQFKVLLQAVEENDTMHITDVLSYEIVPAYEDLKYQVKAAIEDESVN